MVQWKRRFEASNWKVAFTLTSEFNPIRQSPGQNCPVSCQQPTSHFLFHWFRLAFLFMSSRWNAQLTVKLLIQSWGGGQGESCPKTKEVPWALIRKQWWMSRHHMHLTILGDRIYWLKFMEIGILAGVGIPPTPLALWGNQWIWRIRRQDREPGCKFINCLLGEN